MKKVVKIIVIFLLLFFVGVNKVSALTVEENLTLESNITDGIYIPQGKEVILNLNGHDVTGVINKNNNKSTILNEGTLIIEGYGEIKSRQNPSVITQGKSLIIHGGNFDKEIILKLSGEEKERKFEIDGGKFNSKYSKIYLDTCSNSNNFYKDITIKNIIINELILGNNISSNTNSIENLNIENTTITGSKNNSFLYNSNGNLFIKNIDVENGESLITGTPKRIIIENGRFKTLGLSGTLNNIDTTLINLIVTSGLYVEGPNNKVTIKSGYYEEVSNYKQAVSKHLGGNIIIEDGKYGKINGYGEGKINVKGGTIEGTVVSDNLSTITIENGIFKGILISKNTPVNKEVNGNGIFKIKGGTFDIEPINEFIDEKYKKEINIENKIVVTKESEIYNSISSNIIDPTTINNNDIELVKTKAKNKYNIVSYYEVLNSKMTGNDEFIDYVKETEKSLKVTLKLPDNLPPVEEESKRNFVILSFNEGNVEIIDNVEINYSEISFKTNKFSKYALAYYDTNNESKTIVKKLNKNNKKKYTKIIGFLNKLITLSKITTLK